MDFDSSESSYFVFKNGDKVKVKFGFRWYNVEMVENWELKVKKSKSFFVWMNFFV